MLRIGRLGQGNRSQLQRILNAKLRDGHPIPFGNSGNFGIIQRMPVGDGGVGFNKDVLAFAEN